MGRFSKLICVVLRYFLEITCQKTTSWIGFNKLMVCSWKTIHLIKLCLYIETKFVLHVFNSELMSYLIHNIVLCSHQHKYIQINKRRFVCNDHDCNRDSVNIYLGYKSKHLIVCVFGNNTHNCEIFCKLWQQRSKTSWFNQGGIDIPHICLTWFIM